MMRFETSYRGDLYSGTVDFDSEGMWVESLDRSPAQLAEDIRRSGMSAEAFLLGLNEQIKQQQTGKIVEEARLEDDGDRALVREWLNDLPA